MSESAIHISRSGNFRRDRARSYKIFVDNKLLGKIGSGETKVIPIAAGDHRLKLKVDWAVSQTLEFQVPDDRPAKFSCQPNGGSALILLDLLLSIGNLKPYIQLVQDSDDSPKLP
jgi:hypothetical protein